MSNAFDDMRAALAQAKQTQATADSNAGVMAELLVGRLQRSVYSYSTLSALKDELRRYNRHTNRWRKAK